MAINSIMRKEVDLSVNGNQIKYANIEGRKGPYNLDGKRSFNVSLSYEDAKMLYELGWRIKIRGLNPNTGEYEKTKDIDAPFEDMTYMLKVNVTFKDEYPVNIWRIVAGTKKKRPLTPTARTSSWNVKAIDSDVIISADLLLYGWKSRQDGLVTAYLEEATFVVKERSSSDEKYSDFEIEDEPEFIDEE